MLSCRLNNRFFKDFDLKLVENSQKFDFKKDFMTHFVTILAFAYSSPSLRLISF